MPFKLAVGNTVEVPVRFTLKDAGQEKTFKFTLHCDRLTSEEITEAVRNKETPIKEVLADVVKGWEGQKLVLDDEGVPAPFSADALDCLFGVAGLPVTVFNAYLKECGAKSKN